MKKLAKEMAGSEAIRCLKALQAAFGMTVRDTAAIEVSTVGFERRRTVELHTMILVWDDLWKRSRNLWLSQAFEPRQHGTSFARQSCFDVIEENGRTEGFCARKLCKAISGKKLYANRMGTRQHPAGGKELRAEIPEFSCEAELTLKLAAIVEGENVVVQA